MGSRKRLRPDPTVEAPTEGYQNLIAGQLVQETVPSITDGHAEHVPKNELTASGSTKSLRRGSISVKSDSRRTWYAGSSWPRIQKASPSTQVARETILADKSKHTPGTVDLARFEPRRAEVPPAPASSQILQTLPREEQELILADVSSGMDVCTVPGASLDTASRSGNTSSPGLVGAQERATASGWLEWFGLPGMEPEARFDLPRSQAMSRSNDASLGETIQQSLEAPPDPSTPEQTISFKTEGGNTTIAPIPSSFWYNLWAETGPNKKVAKITVTNDSATPEMTLVGASGSSESKRPLPGTTWAFWSKDFQTEAPKNGIAKEPGELAVAGEASQDNPAPAHASMIRETEDEKAKKIRKKSGQLPHDVQESASKALRSSSPDKNQALQTASSQTLVQSAPQPTNLLLPSFVNTYQLSEHPSIIKQITRLLMRHHQAPANHVYLAKDLPKVKKALAIGIHGLFPAAFLRTVIGQPTGTSIRFANHAAAAIHRWASAHGCDCEVEKVALEGEGKIAERVDKLWTLLLNWIDHVRNADLIIIACHSQGVPVALMLTAKMIEFGVVTTARIGICAMAGVSLGPFADYKSRLLTADATELFDFGIQNSEVSKRYISSLREALRYGVRVSFIGSIDDQLVSLESAIFGPVNHPYIYRAVFVDGRVHAPDFIVNLVGFALKLRNLGIRDHGLIRELSTPLAGSLYTGEGHSRLYNEVKIYDDAVSFTLETTSVGDVPLQVQNFELPTNTNPFQLPWCMRGLLEEDIVRTELDQETAELLKQFDEWKPTTRVLKDVKYRLEAIKTKL